MNRSSLDPELLASAVASFPDDAIAVVRRDAADRFLRSGFPASHQEDWKYTNLANAADLSNAWLATAAAPGRQAADNAGQVHIPAVFDTADVHWLVLGNGVILTDIGASAAVPGVEFSRISGADAERLDADEALTSLNTALFRDGLKIKVADDAQADTPVGILLIDDPGDAVTQTRIIVDLGENSALKLIEVYLSAGDGEQFTNSVTQLYQSAGSRLDHVRIQNRSAAHTGTSRLENSLDRDTHFAHASIDLGGSLTRNDVIADINGTDASVILGGLYLASGDQHIDNHTKIVHHVGPATSVEEYRGIATGSSRCVFNGKVIVMEGADGTDSSQSNHNLLLSDHAEIDTKPELEIYADEVKCAHGATVGQLDESALFYLQSRGLDRQQARQVLTKAFAASAIAELAVPECLEIVDSLVENRLEELTDSSI